jgi:formamidopyrimidine-DNA glycosylase
VPELPEVESLRKSLIPYIIGKIIKSVEIKLPKLVSSKGTVRKSSLIKLKAFEDGVINRKIISITRRAKNIIINLDDRGIILVHLKMTGQLAYQDKNSNVVGGHPIAESEQNLPHKHTYIIFYLDEGNLYYNDVRQFGYVLYYKSFEELEKDKHFDKLGLEPLEKSFNFENFYDRIKKKTGVLKKVLLNQEVVVGVGNIYADETCFAAKIRPTRKISSLKKKELQSLFEAIKTILPKAVKMGGSSVANYIMADGSRGTYTREHKVYGRGGKPCFICGRPLEKIVLASRTTVFCKHDQK